MRLLTFIFLGFISITLSLGQNKYEPTYQSNKNLLFSNFISGVRYVYIDLSENDYNTVKSKPDGYHAQIIYGLSDYLKGMGFQECNMGETDNYPDYQSICDLTIVMPSWNYSNGVYTDLTLSFYSCNDDEFRFVSNRKITSEISKIRNAVFNACLDMYGYKKVKYTKQ